MNWKTALIVSGIVALPVASYLVLRKMQEGGVPQDPQAAELTFYHYPTLGPIPYPAMSPQSAWGAVGTLAGAFLGGSLGASVGGAIGGSL